MGKVSRANGLRKINKTRHVTHQCSPYYSIAAMPPYFVPWNEWNVDEGGGGEGKKKDPENVDRGGKAVCGSRRTC